MNQSPCEASIGKRMSSIAESVTLKLNALVQSLKKSGEDVINLTAGEPDFNVPDAAKMAVIEALNKNYSKYTPAAGIEELRLMVAEKTNKQQSGISRKWSKSEIVISNGGKQALFNSLMVLLDHGDEVLIASPYWLSYPDMVRIAGGIPKFIGTTFESGFKITPDQLRNALGPKVKALILNSPSNPTGAVYSRDEFAALGNILLDSQGTENIWIISDEIYDRIILDDVPFCSFLNASPDLQNRCITINGMSKSASMTGWRIGWSVAPERLTRASIKIQGHTTSGINSLAQWASIAALKLPESHFIDQIDCFRRRRDLVLDILEKSRKIKICPPKGAFYAFIGIRGSLKAGEDSVVFAERLLQDAKVAVVPGTAFGEPDYVRLSFATDERSIQEGCKRFVAYLEGHNP